ncbi:MAG TPA: hypothetical protein VF534_31060 [Paraburkholderia sp.]
MFKRNPPLSPESLARARTEGLTMPPSDLLCDLEALEAVLAGRLKDHADWWLAAHGLRGEIVDGMLILRKR